MRVYLRPQHLQLGFSSRRFGFGQSQLSISGGSHRFDSEVEQAPANEHTGAEVEKNAKSKKSGENFFLLKVTDLVKGKSETQLRQTSDEADGNNGDGNPLYRYLPPKEPAVDQSHDECGEQECQPVPIQCDDGGRRTRRSKLATPANTSAKARESLQNRGRRDSASLDRLHDLQPAARTSFTMPSASSAE